MTEAIRPDTYAKVAEPGENLNGLDLSAVDGNTVSAPLKITHNAHVCGGWMRVPQGKENALDLTDSHDVCLVGEFGGGGVKGDQVVTVKGGCRNIDLRLTVVGEPGRQHSHIQVGNWMDQTPAPTWGVHIHAEHRDGGPVNVVTGWVVPFSIHLSGDCEWLWWESMKLKAYIVAKFIVRAVLRIPRGVKGPSFM